MAGDILTTEHLALFLGVDPEEETLELIERLRASAVEELCRVTGINWTRRGNVASFNEALRTSVWLSYYAVRDGAKNTQFLQEYLTGLVCSLQLCRREESDGI